MSDTITDIVKKLTEENLMLTQEVKDLTEMREADRLHRVDIEKQRDDALDAKKWFMDFYDRLHMNACDENRLRKRAEKKYEELLKKIRNLSEENSNDKSE